MRRNNVVNEMAFFELLNEEKVARNICKSLGQIVSAQEKLNRFLANGPTARDIENEITEDVLIERINRTKRNFRNMMIKLSVSNGRFLNYVKEEDTDSLISEVTTFIYTLRLTNAIFHTA